MESKRQSYSLPRVSWCLVSPWAGRPLRFCPLHALPSALSKEAHQAGAAPPLGETVTQGPMWTGIFVLKAAEVMLQGEGGTKGHAGRQQVHTTQYVFASFSFSFMWLLVTHPNQSITFWSIWGSVLNSKVLVVDRIYFSFQFSLTQQHTPAATQLELWGLLPVARTASLPPPAQGDLATTRASFGAAYFNATPCCSILGRMVQVPCFPVSPITWGRGQRVLLCPWTHPEGPLTFFFQKAVSLSASHLCCHNCWVWDLILPSL